MFYDAAAAAGGAFFPVHQLCQQLEGGGGTVADTDGRITAGSIEQVGKIVHGSLLMAVAEVKMLRKGDHMSFLGIIQQLVHLPGFQQEQHIILQLIGYKIHYMLPAAFGKPYHLVMIMPVRLPGKLGFKAQQRKNIELPCKGQLLIRYIRVFLQHTLQI